MISGVPPSLSWLLHHRATPLLHYLRYTGVCLLSNMVHIPYCFWVTHYYLISKDALRFTDHQHDKRQDGYNDRGYGDLIHFSIPVSAPLYEKSYISHLYAFPYICFFQTPVSPPPLFISSSMTAFAKCFASAPLIFCHPLSQRFCVSFCHFLPRPPLVFWLFHFHA